MTTSGRRGGYRQDPMAQAMTDPDTSTADEQVQAVRSEAAHVRRRLRVTEGQLKAQGISPKQRRFALRKSA